MKRCDKDLRVIVHRLTVVGQDDVVAPVQSNKCPSPLFPPHPSSPSYHRHLFTFPNNQSVRVGQGEARDPKTCDGVYREIGEAGWGQTSQGGETGFQESSRLLSPSLFKCFAKQEKEEEAAGNEGRISILAEQIRGQGFRKAVFCSTSSAKSAFQNSTTSTRTCWSSSLHRPCFPRWLELYLYSTCSMYVHCTVYTNRFRL